MINIFTLAFNCVDDLRDQWKILQGIKVPFRWSIVEGYARPIACTSWCKPLGDRWHQNGSSTDGTCEFLKIISSDPRVSVQLANRPWAGKKEMVNAALEKLTEAGTLIQMDADEFWSLDQILVIDVTLRRFPKIGGLQFFCRLWMTERHVIFSEGTYGSRPYEWHRAWSYDGKQRFSEHEPPRLQGSDTFIARDITRTLGLVFDHRSYVRREQVELKEDYYGYRGAVAGWQRLRESNQPVVFLRDYLPWVTDDAKAFAIIPSNFPS
jgi:hypothetical protein